jgi:hypothetical protein
MFGDIIALRTRLFRVLVNEPFRIPFGHFPDLTLYLGIKEQCLPVFRIIMEYPDILRQMGSGHIGDCHDALFASLSVHPDIRLRASYHGIPDFQTQQLVKSYRGVIQKNHNHPVAQPCLCVCGLSQDAGHGILRQDRLFPLRFFAQRDFCNTQCNRLQGDVSIRCEPNVGAQGGNPPVAGAGGIANYLILLQIFNTLAQK